MKKKTHVLVVVGALFLLSGVSFAKEAPKAAKAELIGADGKKVGIANL